MELTGKCKEDFENWFNDHTHKEDEMYQYYLDKFYRMHASMQWGVYVDFFDSAKIFITTGVHGYNISAKDESINHKTVSRIDARTRSIKIANEIYNNQYLGNELYRNL